jgi:hypothetical protein
MSARSGGADHAVPALLLKPPPAVGWLKRDAAKPPDPVTKDGIWALGEITVDRGTAKGHQPLAALTAFYN